MSEPESAIQVVKPEPKSVILAGGSGVQLRTFDEMWRFSGAVVKAGMTPRSMDTQEKVLIALQYGLEVGLSPMQSIQSIAVINNKPGLSGDAAKALIVRREDICESWEESWENAEDPEKMTSVIVSRRKGRKTPDITKFGVSDAKKAKLWGKAGPWSDYPKRMLRYRCVGFHSRDYFGDILKGLYVTEELNDFGDIPEKRVLPVEKNVTPITFEDNDEQS